MLWATVANLVGLWATMQNEAVYVTVSALRAIAQDLVMRDGPQLSIWLCTMGHSAEYG